MRSPAKPLIPLQRDGAHLNKLSLPPMQNLPIYTGTKAMNGVFRLYVLGLDAGLIFSIKFLKEPLHLTQPVPMGPNPVLVPCPVPPKGIDQDTTSFLPPDTSKAISHYSAYTASTTSSH